MEVDQTSASKPGTSEAAVNLESPPRQPWTTSDQLSSSSEEPSKKASDRPKKLSHCQYNDESDEPRMSSSESQKHADKSKHKVRSRYVSSSSEEDQSSVARHRSSKPSGPQPSGAISDQDQPQHDPDPPYYREIALSDVPSQYAEEVDNFRRILSLPDPRDSMPRSPTSVMGLDDEKGRQELRPRGPSSMLPLSSIIKDAFDKFKHGFQAANLPEGKYIKHPPSTTKWYKVGQPCYEYYRFLQKSVILLNPLGLLRARFPYQFLRNWNTKLGKTYPALTLLLPLPRLHLLTMPLLRSTNIA